MVFPPEPKYSLIKIFVGRAGQSKKMANCIQVNQIKQKESLKKGDSKAASGNKLYELRRIFVCFQGGVRCA
jgi:hypothetical protein